MFKKIVFISFILLFLLSTPPAQAASLYFKIDNNSAIETLFILSLDSGTEYINAIDGKIPYDAVNFDCTASPGANSIINIWITPPAAKKGEITLAGIIPGGYSGKGELATIICTSKNDQNKPILELKTDVFELLLNDGTGKPAGISIGDNQNITTEEHKALIERKNTDKIPPEITNLEIAKNTALTEDNYLLIFNAVDKQTGVASIAMSATTKKYDTEKDFRAIIDTLTWTDAQNPLAMTDKMLGQYIYLKVTDQAGNIKLSRLSPVKSWREINLTLILFSLILLALAAMLRIVLKLRRKK